MKRIYLIIMMGMLFLFSLFFYYADIQGISPRVIMIIILSAVTFLSFKKLPKDNLTKMLLIFGVYSTLIRIIFFSEPITDVLKGLTIYIFVPYLLIYIVIANVDTEKKHKDCINILIILTLINCVFIIGQFLDINLFWEIRNLIAPISQDVSRPAGLTSYAIDLAYNLVLFVPLSFVYFARKTKSYLLIIPILIMIAVMLSLTRSSTFIILLLFVIFILSSYNKKSKTALFLIFIILLIVSIPLISLTRFERIMTLEDSSAQGRITLFSQAITSIVKYPFGTGSEGYLRAWSTAVTPHNQFLNIAAFYGIPSLILLLIFTYLLFKTSIDEIKNAKNDYFRTINFILLLSLIGFTFNSLFHNTGFFTGNAEVYIIIGLIVASKR